MFVRFVPINVVFAVIMTFGGALNVQAVKSLSEDELDQTNAGGIEYSIIGDETKTLEVENPDWFLNEIFGQNEVITRVVVEMITRMDFPFRQSIEIGQEHGPEDLTVITGAETNVSLVVDGSKTDKASELVINNIFGRNQVETAVNLTVILPVSPGASVGGYSNPFAVDGSPAATTGVVNTPVTVPQATIPQYERPTTLSGAVSLMDGLAQQYPQAAPGLQNGISTVQSFQK